MTLLKYLIMQDPHGALHPVVFDSCITHAEAAPRGLRALSAGFLVVYDDHLAIPDIGSESLGLSPRPGDLDLLRVFLGHSHNIATKEQP